MKKGLYEFKLLAGKDNKRGSEEEFSRIIIQKDQDKTDGFKLSNLLEIYLNKI